MKEITGVLKRLGQARLERVYNIYSMIEIGDEILTDVKIPRRLDPFLNEGLKTTKPTTIAMMAGKVIMAVQVEGQDRYVARYNWGAMNFGGAVLLILTFLLFGLLNNSLYVAAAGLAVFYWFYVRTVLQYLKIAGEGGKKF